MVRDVGQNNMGPLQKKKIKNKKQSWRQGLLSATALADNIQDLKFNLQLSK